MIINIYKNREYVFFKMLYTIDKQGVKKALVKDNILHAIGIPAVIHPSGVKEWWKNNKKHNSSGPAVVFEDGGMEWWVNGKKHRENGPAVFYANGHREWWLDGKLHREDGPAVEYNNACCILHTKRRRCHS